MVLIKKGFSGQYFLSFFLAGVGMSPKKSSFFYALPFLPGKFPYMARHHNRFWKHRQYFYIQRETDLDSGCPCKS